MNHFRSWKIAPILCLVLVIFVGAGAWLTRSTWLSWYYVRELKQAQEQHREAWIERIIGLDEAATPRLLSCLMEENQQACDNAGLALARLGEHWGWNDPRTAELTQRLAQSFSRQSFAGQQATLKLQFDWLKADSQPTPEALELALQLVRESLHSSSRDVRAAGYETLSVLVRRHCQDRHIDQYRELVRRGLEEQDAALRELAVRAATVPELELLERLLPLLKDSSAEVRRATLLALGAATTIVHDEELLPWLNDEDADVRRLCEAALRGRGIPQHCIRLARMATHPHHAVRLEAIKELVSHSDPDPTEWYRKLLHDPQPSVQVAALRAACSSREVEARLRDNFEELATHDPSATVRQLAKYYLSE